MTIHLLSVAFQTYFRRNLTWRLTWGWGRNQLTNNTCAQAVYFGSLSLLLVNTAQIRISPQSFCISAQSCRERLILKLWQHNWLTWGGRGEQIQHSHLPPLQVHVRRGGSTATKLEGEMLIYNPSEVWGWGPRVKGRKN